MKNVTIKVRGAGKVWLTVRDGVIVGAMGCEPRQYIGLALAAVLAMPGRKVVAS